MGNCQESIANVNGSKHELLLRALLFPVQEDGWQQSVGHIAGSWTEKVLTLWRQPCVLSCHISGSAQPAPLSINHFVTPCNDKTSGQPFGVSPLQGLRWQEHFHLFQACCFHIHGYRVKLGHLLCRKLWLLIAVWKDQLFQQSIICCNITRDIITCQAKVKLFHRIKLTATERGVIVIIFMFILNTSNHANPRSFGHGLILTIRRTRNILPIINRCRKSSSRCRCRWWHHDSRGWY